MKTLNDGSFSLVMEPNPESQSAFFCEARVCDFQKMAEPPVQTIQGPNQTHPQCQSTLLQERGQCPRTVTENECKREHKPHFTCEYKGFFEGKTANQFNEW